jgi:hypothetical protein
MARMTKERYLKRMQRHEIRYHNQVWMKIVEDTNAFIKDNPDVGMYQLSKLDSIIDSLSLAGAWIQDRINGYSGVYSHPSYKKSLAKKIRKALGYTY